MHYTALAHVLLRLINTSYLLNVKKVLIIIVRKKESEERLAVVIVLSIIERLFFFLLFPPLPSLVFPCPHLTRSMIINSPCHPAIEQLYDL